MAFLIGVVLAFMGAVQLRQFGAEIFVVDLIAIAVLRELGILLTAIIVAGRSASAFTASIGSMKMREEIDAMRTLGLDPIQVLVVPRVLALRHHPAAARRHRELRRADRRRDHGLARPRGVADACSSCGSTTRSASGTTSSA